MSQSDSVHVLRNKTSLPGLNARPNEGASPVPPRPYQIRGRSSTTSSASFTTAFPIGAGPRNTTTSVASTSSTGRRPLPSPPKITIATASGSSDTRDAISPLASSGNLSPPSALATRPAPSPKPRARTQSGSRTPVPARQTLPARTAPTSIGAGYDVANNTLVIRPLKSSERNVPAPLTLRSADRPFNRTTPPNSASDRRAVTSPERIPPSTVNQMSPSPPTRSPQTASTAPPFLARKPAHSRTNSANNPTTTTLFSSPTSAGLRLNTTIVSPSSFPRPKVSPSPPLSHVRPPPSKSRTLPLVPLSGQSSHSQPSTISPRSHPPGAIASPTVASGPSPYVSYSSSSFHSQPLQTPDSTSTVSTAETLSTAGSLATPDSVTSSSHANTLVAARRMGMLTHGVHIRTGSIDDGSQVSSSPMGIMRSAPVIPRPDVYPESIPSNLNDKGKTVLRPSRTMEIDADSDAHSAPLALNAQRRRKRDPSSESSSGDQAGITSASKIGLATPVPTQQRIHPLQPQLLIPPNVAPSSQRSLNAGTLSPHPSSALTPSSDKVPSPLSFHHASSASSMTSVAESPRNLKPYPTLRTNAINSPSLAPSPLSYSPVSQPSPVSPFGSSEGDEDGGEHSHPAFPEDMISVVSRESTFFAPPGSQQSLTFAHEEHDRQARKKRRSSMFTSSTSPVDARSTTHHRNYSLNPSPIEPPLTPGSSDSPISPFGPRPGSSGEQDKRERGEVYDWGAVLNSSKAAGKQRRSSRPLSGISSASGGSSGRNRRSGGSRRRKSWGGGAGLDTDVDMKEPVPSTPATGRKREGSISPISYAPRQGSVESLIVTDMDDGIWVDDGGVGDMDIEVEMQFAATHSASDEEIESGLDAMGMPRSSAIRRRRTTRTITGVKTGMWASDQGDTMSLREGRSRSRPRREDTKDEPPLPPLPLPGRDFSVPVASPQSPPSAWGVARSMSPAVRLSTSSSRTTPRKASALQPSRNVPPSPPPLMQFEPSELATYPSVIGTPFGIGVSSSSSRPKSDKEKEKEKEGGIGFFNAFKSKKSAASISTTSSASSSDLKVQGKRPRGQSVDVLSTGGPVGMGAISPYIYIPPRSPMLKKGKTPSLSSTEGAGGPGSVHSHGSGSISLRSKRQYIA